MLQLSLVTMLVRKMRLKFFWSRPSFRDVASVANHDIGARNAIDSFWSGPSNAIEFFFKSTKLWRCCVCRYSIYWCEKCEWSFFEVDKGVLKNICTNSHKRESFFFVAVRANFFQSPFRRPSFGDVASVANHDIGAKNAIEKFLKSMKGKLHSKIISSDKVFFRRIRWWRSEVEIRTTRRSNRRRKNWHKPAFVTSWCHTGATSQSLQGHATESRYSWSL